jgi:hypothetical protein
MRRPIRASDFLTTFSAIVAGMALTFVALSSSTVSYRLLAALLGIGAGLTALSLRWKTAKRRVSSVCKETVLVDSEASSEIVFSPQSPMRDPVLYMTAHGRPVLVEDVWHDDVSLVASPVPVARWRQGVTCHGVVDARHPLRIVVRNPGYAPAAVRASLSAHKEE